MKVALKKRLKAAGKTEKDCKAIDSVIRRAKELFADCDEQRVRVVMTGRAVKLVSGEVLLAELAYPKR
jgi:intracellular sulfur oxidation DsrE/DsrF family protein